MYLPAETAALFRPSVNLGLYFHLQSTPQELRLWSGVGDIEQTLPPVQVTPVIYQHVRMVNWPDFEIMLNGGAERGEFTLEGVSVEAQNDIAGLGPVVLGKPLYIGIAAHDANWQKATDILPLSTAIADYWSMAYQRIEGTGQPTRTLSLSVGFGETGRTRPRRLIYSETQQQTLYPGDRFCLDVPRYNRGYQISWPRF